MNDAARITNTWVARASDGSPVCLGLNVSQTSKHVNVDLYFEDGELVGVKAYTSPRSKPEPMLEAGKVPQL